MAKFQMTPNGYFFNPSSSTEHPHQSSPPPNNLLDYSPLPDTATQSLISFLGQFPIDFLLYSMEISLCQLLP